jgi:hypothetical protein
MTENPPGTFRIERSTGHSEGGQIDVNPVMAPAEPTLTTSIDDLEKMHEQLRDRAAAEASNLLKESARLDALEARRG